MERLAPPEPGKTSTQHRSGVSPTHGILATVVAALAAPVAGQLGFLAAFGIAKWIAGPNGFVDWGAVPPLWAIAMMTLMVQGTLALVAVATPVLLRVSWRDALALRAPRWWLLPLAPLGAISLGPVGDLFMEGTAFLIRRHIDPQWESGSIEMILSLARETPLWATIPLIALLPGIAEELLFRGMLQRSLGSGWLAVLVAGIAFALFHFDPVHIAGVFPIGVYLGFLLKETGSLWVPIAGHAGNNAFSLIASNIDFFDVGYATETPMPTSWIVVGLVVASLVTFLVLWGTRGSGAVARGGG